MNVNTNNKRGASYWIAFYGTKILVASFAWASFLAFTILVLRILNVNV